MIYSPHPTLKSRRRRWAGHVGYCEEDKRIQDFGGETGGKTPLGRPRFRVENNIKMDHQEF